MAKLTIWRADGGVQPLLDVETHVEVVEISWASEKWPAIAFKYPVNVNRQYGHLALSLDEVDDLIQHLTAIKPARQREWGPQTQWLQSEIALMVERVFRNVWTKFYKDRKKAMECELLDAIAKEFHELIVEEKNPRIWDTRCPCCGQRKPKE